MLQPPFVAGGEKTLEGFVHGFAAKRKGAIMHGHHVTGAEVAEGSEGFLGIHVNLAAAHGLIGTDGEHGEVNVAVLTDFRKAVKVSAVTAVIDSASGFIANEEAAEATVDIMDHAGTPVFGWSEGDFQRTELQT